MEKLNIMLMSNLENCLLSTYSCGRARIKGSCNSIEK